MKISKVFSLAGDDEADGENVDADGAVDPLATETPADAENGSVARKIVAPVIISKVVKTEDSAETYKDKVLNFWQHNCHASRDELAWAGEYEDHAYYKDSSKGQSGERTYLHFRCYPLLI
jgi:hypothetical protein